MAKRFVDFKKLRNFRLLRRIFFLLIFLGIEEGLKWADNLGYITIPTYLDKSFEVVLWTLGSLIVVTIVLRLTENRVFRFNDDEVDLEQRILFTKIYSNTLYLLVAAVVFWKMGLEIENITIFLGLITTGVAFAVRDVINSYFAWFIILTKHPFRIGDYVKIGDEAGTVERIGTFFVTLQNPGATDFIKVPNNTLLSKAIINMGKNRVMHTVKFPVKIIPPDIQARMDKLDELAKSIVSEKVSPKTQIQADGGTICLYIVLTLPVGQVTRRTEFIVKANEVLSDIIAEPRALLS
ncbi:mechanosensitive ion channel domain-containing protein [uncultured Imperialibacter sp.]|uniref:mechanosensitive ion channel domain-containing protein n=1 Tax=uncultured Imperialibacter sp. TaxID=1672639 RepID=UPI0030D8DD43|tara:strand:+ start:1987 stop:2868 length:882 start_codon:yes stop_codon:yes gene_type:complete